MAVSRRCSIRAICPRALRQTLHVLRLPVLLHRPRHEFLERRPPPGLRHSEAMGYRDAKYVEIFDIARSDIGEHARGNAAGKSAQGSHRTVVKNTFIEVDTSNSCDSESVGAASAPEFSLQPAPIICHAQEGSSTARGKIEVAAMDRDGHEVCSCDSEGSLGLGSDNTLDLIQLDLMFEAKFRSFLNT